MSSAGKRLWFPAKRYGWGWGLPSAWQGWVTLVVWLAATASAYVLLPPDRHAAGFLGTVAGLTGGLILVCLIKGEKPRWRWGKADDAQDQSAAEPLAVLADLRRRRLISNSEYEAKRREIARRR